MYWLKKKVPDHNKTFYVEAYSGRQNMGRGSGQTKKAAEQQAAYQAIIKLRRRKG